MNTWAKMVMALRGGLNEAGEAVVDSQALRILDQGVRDAAEELKQCRDGLATILARQKLAKEQCEQLKASIDEYEGYAQQAVDKNDQSLAFEVAQKVVNLENQFMMEQRSAADFANKAADLRIAVNTAEQNIKRIKQQVDTVKATESVQRAQAAVAARYNGTDSKLCTAMESLARIKEKQALAQAQMSTVDELVKQQADSLEEKLKAAGITPNGTSAYAVLSRLRGMD